MPGQDLERRVRVIESQLEQLKAEIGVVRQNKNKDWQRAVEKYTGDPDLQAIFAQAMKLRDADRKLALAKADASRDRGKSG